MVSVDVKHHVYLLVVAAARVEDRVQPRSSRYYGPVELAPSASLPLRNVPGG